MNKIRILLADDHLLFRQGVRNLLSQEPDMEVVGEAGDAAEALARVDETRPDIVLLDVGMPGLSCFEAARQIRREQPDTQVVFLSMYDDDDYLNQGVEAGARGYILKDSPIDQLLTAIHEVRRGGSYLSPRLLTRLVAGFRAREGSPWRSPVESLTKRERDVLKMLAEGRTVKEIAGQFQLSVKTIEAHKFNLMRKLDLHNKAQLVHFAIHKKVIPA